MKKQLLNVLAICLFLGIKSFGQSSDVQPQLTFIPKNELLAKLSQLQIQKAEQSESSAMYAVQATKADQLPVALPDSSTSDSPGLRSKIQATIGVEGYLVMQGKDKQMTDEINGLGMSKGLGFSLRADYRLIKSVALSLNVGFSQWTIEKRYFSEGQPRYESSEKMGSVPVSLGAKVYIPKITGLYVMPEIGIAFINVKTTTSDTYPVPSLDIKDSNTPLQFGGNIGYEIRKGKLLIDVSAKFQVTQIKSNLSSFNSTLNQPYQFAGLRIGVGI